jgi:hypothetical protein
MLMGAISDRTTITIGLVISLLGASGFITNIYFKSEANAQTLTELKTELKDELRLLRAEMKELRLELKEAHVKLGK